LGQPATWSSPEYHLRGLVEWVFTCYMSYLSANQWYLSTERNKRLELNYIDCRLQLCQRWLQV